MMANAAVDPLRLPLTFTAEETGSTVALNVNGTLTIPGMHYRMGKSGSWMPYTAGTVIDLPNIGDSCQFWNSRETLSESEANYATFAFSGRVASIGNIQSLLNWSMIVPAWGFSHLFRFSSKLTTLPLLPALTVEERGYRLFAAYSGAGNHVSICYETSFGTLGFGFLESGITSVELIGSSRPQQYQLYQVFKGCAKLSTIKVHFTQWVDADAISQWVSGVSSTGTFYKPSALPEEYGTSRIPTGWSVVNID
jgi:hypothetical protein